MKYCLLPLGCQMNKSDSERISRVLEEMGFIATDKEEDAQILGMVCCSVRQRSINRVYSRIQKWKEWKSSKPILTFLSGCVLPEDENKLKPMFDLLFKINELPHLPELLTQRGFPGPKALLEKENNSQFALQIIPDNANEDFEKDFWKIEPRYSSKFQAYIPIQNGCNKFCTYCAVPYTRGREVSRPSSEILAEIQNLVSQDYKSLTLLGQNVNSYGLDRPYQELNFANLLEEIGKIGQNTGKEFWLYYTSPHPSDMTIDVLRVMAKYPCLAKHVHLPIQAGDDEVLRRMNRSYSLAEYRQIVENIRIILPTATLFTDIIVGFSGETKEQFEQTLATLQEFRFDMAYIAQYSPRPGATSYDWKDDVSVEEKKLRFQQLTDNLKKITLENNQKMIGKVYKVLVEDHDRKAGYLAARTEGLIPVHFPSVNAELIGEFVKIKINSVTPFAGAGELV